MEFNRDDLTKYEEYLLEMDVAHKKYVIQIEKIKKERKRTTLNIEEMLGCAIYKKNDPLISQINLFIKDNNINIDKKRVVESIYWAGNRENSRKHKNTLTTYGEFTDDMYREYKDKYNVYFEYS